MNTGTTMSNRVHEIYEDCGGVHATDGLHDGCIFGTGLCLNQSAIDAYRPELRDMLKRISPEIRTGCSWQVCMCDDHDEAWADSATVTEFIMLLYKARLVDPLTPAKVKELQQQGVKVSIFAQPWYRMTA